MENEEALRIVNDELMQTLAGGCKEFTEWHLAALKACVAMSELKPVDNEFLLETIATNRDDFGVIKHFVEYKSISLSDDNDDSIMLIQEYGLSVMRLSTLDEWVCCKREDEVALISECLHTAVSDCIASLTTLELDI